MIRGWSVGIDAVLDVVCDAVFVLDGCMTILGGMNSVVALSVPVALTLCGPGDDVVATEDSAAVVEDAIDVEGTC